jgi:hypothetical protein
MSDQAPMQSPFIIGLSSWIIQDGNYEDFRRGDQASFALEFYAPTVLSVFENSRETPSLEHLHSSTYQIVGKIVHVRDPEWWAIDTGLLMYGMGRPPEGAGLDTWVGGEVYIGVDHFAYLQSLSRHHTAPGLIYDWSIRKIEIQTAPFVKISEREMARDPERLGWREIPQTDAWHDGVGAEYLLYCERLNSPPRR